MPDVNIHAVVPAADAAHVYQRLRTFEAYPQYTAAVREVRVVPISDSSVEAHWAVNFRNGVLCWTEHDTFDAETLTIAFKQIDGDFERFDGTWTVTKNVDTVVVHFACTFDLGMPSLAAIIDPIACEALEDNIKLILAGLLGDTVSFDAPAALATTSAR